MDDGRINSNQPDIDPVFKSTEIYKSQSKKGDDVFEKEKTKKEKLLEWMRAHKLQCILIGVGAIVILAAIILAIVLLVNSSEQEQASSDTGQTSDIDDTNSIPTSAAGGNFYYTDCGSEESTSSIETVAIRACKAAALDFSISSYLNTALKEIKALKSDTDKATAYNNLLIVLTTYKNNLEQNNEEAPTELLQKMVEIAVKQDDILQTETSAMQAYYYAEMANDTATQEKYARIYSERTDGVDITNREEIEGVSG